MDWLEKAFIYTYLYLSVYRIRRFCSVRLLMTGFDFLR